MKRLLFCLVALIAVFAMVMPTYAAEVKFSGLFHNRFIARDNYDGDDDTDDSGQYVTQRFRMYFNAIASENLKVVYKSEVDTEWGDGGDYKVTDSNGNEQTVFANRNDGGGLGGDRVNMETKNIYLEFMVPDTPVKVTTGLQGVALHRGWFMDDDVSALRFDMNFDPMTITAYWAWAAGGDPDFNGIRGADKGNSSDDVWQLVVSGAYKAENMDARLTLGYEKGDDDYVDPGSGTVVNGTIDEDNFYMIMGEFGMSFDMVSFFVIAGINFGEIKGVGAVDDRDYKGYAFDAGVNFALDLATLRVRGIYATGDKDTAAGEDNFRGMSGQTMGNWAEITNDQYFYDRNAPSPTGGNQPTNMMGLNVGADFKPTDTTTIKADVYYMALVEDRNDEDEIGTEIDVRLSQKVYDNLTANLVGAYLLAEDGWGEGDDAFQVGVGLDYSF
jgi:hypothetical protein